MTVFTLTWESKGEMRKNESCSTQCLLVAVCLKQRGGGGGAHAMQSTQRCSVYVYRTSFARENQTLGQSVVKMVNGDGNNEIYHKHTSPLRPRAFRVYEWKT